MTTDPFACRGTTHPAMPNVRDLAAENTTLRAHIDKLVIELARCRGVTEDVIRTRRGLPPGNPWTARRDTQEPAVVTVHPFPVPRHTPPVTGPQNPETEYAI